MSPTACEAKAGAAETFPAAMPKVGALADIAARERFAIPLVVSPEAPMTSETKIRFYQAEAARCRRLASGETCDDAREYYEALARDYIKLASGQHEAEAADGGGMIAK